MTAPSFTPPTAVDCYVTIGGERVADGTTDVESPVALSGAKVVWGRATTVDQPDAASASFQIADYSGDRTFAKLAAVGRLCTIRASATAWSGSSSIDTIPDPSFTGGTYGQTPPNVVARSGTAKVAVVGDGGKGLQITTTGKSAPVALILPGPPSTLVDAWDLIPTTVVGSPWKVSIGNATAAPGVTIRVGVARISSPTEVASAVIEWDPTPWSPSSAYARTYTPKVAGVWLGIAVKLDPWALPWDHAAPPAGWGAGSWDEIPDSVTWDYLGDGIRLDNAQLAAPVPDSIRDVVVFAGRITDAVAAWDEQIGACLVDVTASDLTADLGNRDVGAAPWPAEALSARVSRILTAAGMPTLEVVYGPSPVNLGALQVGRVDVDRQQCWPMISGLVSGVDGVAWLGVHSSVAPYVYVEDPAGRPPGLALVDVDGSPAIEPDTTVDGVILSAHRVDLEPVRWVQTNADLATRVAVRWQDQTTSPDPTERTVELRRDDLEALTDDNGVRAVSVGSQVTSSADATGIADRVLIRLARNNGWRVGNVRRRVEVDESVEEVNDLLDLLDGTTRLGRPVVLVDLPPWSPVDVDAAATYLEGGAYEYTDGRWILDLVLSDATGTGGSVQWDELDPAWSWDSFGEISWDDLQGVGPPPSTTTIG